MLDNTCNAPFLSWTADWHDLVSHCISFSKANLHPKLPVFWSLGISSCSTLACDTTSKKNSAVNQTELKPSNIQEFWCLILCCTALCSAGLLCVAERNPSQPKHWQQPVNRSMGFSACDFAQLLHTAKPRSACEKLGFPCNITGPVSWRAGAKCQAVCSSQLQPVPFFQVALRGATERWQECSVWLCSL